MIWIQFLDRMDNLELTRNKKRKHRKHLEYIASIRLNGYFCNFYDMGGDGAVMSE